MEIVHERLGAVSVTAGTTSATTLVEEVKARILSLAKMGIGKGSVVALSQQASPGFFHDLLAVWSRGAGRKNRIQHSIFPAATGSQRILQQKGPA
jgi:hypothetical protein